MLQVAAYFPSPIGPQLLFIYPAGFSATTSSKLPFSLYLFISLNKKKCRDRLHFFRKKYEIMASLAHVFISHHQIFTDIIENILIFFT